MNCVFLLTQHSVIIWFAAHSYHEVCSTQLQDAACGTDLGRPVHGTAGAFSPPSVAAGASSRPRDLRCYE